MADIEQYYKNLVSGKKEGVGDRLLFGILVCCSFVYASLMRLRASAYAIRLLPVRRLDKPVIAVGNIVAGGTGKTPVVAWLARHLITHGKRVAVLSRGYGGTFSGDIHIVSDGENIYATPEEAGDEPLLLASSIPGLIVVVGSDRHKAGILAQERCQPDFFILDDGFQHMRLHRDLNILLLDCRHPFANGRTFPAGLSREPKSAVKRADFVIFTRCKSGEEELPSIAGKTTYYSSHELSGYIPLAGGEIQPFNKLGLKRGVAFAGITDPAGFFDSLEAAGVHPVATLAFADHICYGEREISALCNLKTASRADYLITTEKDAVKLHPYITRLGTVHVALLELRFENSTEIETRLDELLRGH